MLSPTLSQNIIAWLLTYWLHSTILLSAAWFLTRPKVGLSIVARDFAWKVALVGGVATATLQITAFEPVPGILDVTRSTVTTPAPATPSLPVVSFDAPTQPLTDEVATAATRSKLETTETQSPAAVAAEQQTPLNPIAASTPIGRVGDFLTGLHWIEVFLAVWLAVVLFGLSRLAVARVRVSHLLVQRRAIRDPDLVGMLHALRGAAGLQFPIRLTWSSAITTPVAFRREICLPKRALVELSRDQYHCILAHELAHIVRRDPFWFLLGLLAQRVFFFQPLNRVARRSMSDLAEYLCDDWAVTHTGTKLTFAESLAEVASWIDGRQLPVLMPTMAENGSRLVRRVERILDTSRSPTQWAPHRMRAPTAAAGLMVVALSVPGVGFGDGQANDLPEQDAPISSPEARSESQPTDLDKPAPAAAESAIVDATPTDTGELEIDSSAAEGGKPATAVLPAVTSPTLATRATQTNEAVQAETGSGLDPAAAWAPTPPDADPESQQSTDTVVINSLIRALQDEDADVRKEAAYALGELKSPVALPALFGALRDVSPDVRVRAVIALGGFRDVRMIEPLGVTLHDTSATVRRYAASVLGRANDPRSVPLLLPLLRDSDTRVRRTAVQAIGRYKTPEAIDPLTASLGDPDDDVRQYAVSALGQIEDERIVPVIMQALGDDSASVRSVAARALGRSRDPRAVPTLIDALGDSHAGVRERVVRSLGAIKDRRALTPIADRLRDDNAEVREQAAGVLDDFQDRSIVPALIEALQDSVADVRQAAVRSLANLKDARAVQPITRLLQDESADIRAIAARALDDFGDLSVVMPLIGSLDDPHPGVRASVLKALEELEDARAIEPAIRLLADTEPAVRAAAAHLLGELKATQATVALLNAVRDSVIEVRSAMLRALVEMREPRGVPAVIDALGDPSPVLRRSAARWLGYLEDPRGVDPLIEALRDEDSRVRAAAARALAQLGNR